jgi:rhamnulose-1-phosphate aldolase/alcohol dehydrogenase
VRGVSIEGGTELERLVARSRLIGADPSLVLHGGGNTSSKIVERDHLGRERRVLRIKGSGSDLATIEARHFPGLWLDELEALRARDAMSDDEMVAYLARCLVEPEAPRPSIETLLHAFLPAAHVDHVHADAVCALANAPDPTAAVHEVLGEDVAVVEYIRPGFELSKRVAELAEARAVVLAHHGLVTWGETHEESYELTVELVALADRFLAESGVPSERGEEPDGAAAEAFLARLRGRLSRGRRVVIATDRSQRGLADRADVETLAGLRSTPDHMLRIGARTCVLALDGSIDGAVERFEEERSAFHDRNAGPADPPALSPAPRVALVRGFGCVAAAPDARDARVRIEIAVHSHASAAATLDAFGDASWLDEREVFDFEYWPLELYKLTVAPPPPEFAGHVVIVTGAASGIGRQVALDLAGRGAHVALADLDGDGLAGTAASIDESISVVGDLTEPAVVDELVHRAVAAYGGLDAVVFNAGIASTGTLGELLEEDWRRSLEVNLTAHFLLTKRAWRVLAEQGIGGSLVYVASKNAFAPSAGFAPYSVAKAGLVQLAKIAALEGGGAGIRANVVNPDAVFGDSRLWSEELRRERAAAHGVTVEELEGFYASRRLLGRAVTATDVAEAVAFLVSDRSRATTGATITVDGGVPAAFPR